MLEVDALADELMSAYATGRLLAAPPSVRDPGFDLATAYAVEAELVRRRRASGRTTVGRKVGFANKAMWRIFKLDTLVWAHMYDDTVHEATANVAVQSTAGCIAPRLEPEIVFKLHTGMPAGVPDARSILGAVDWMALGFEINDCVFPDWKFSPADFVAAFGFHTALVIGEPQAIEADQIPALEDALGEFRLQLSKNGELVEEGTGRASLRSPALCLGELASAIARRPGAEPLAAGEIISTGTLTSAQPIASGERWRAEVEGLALPALTLDVVGR
jgi:2-oxo-3-hexenedioate decarboxylase